MLTSLAIGWVSRRGNLRGDTAIGVLFAGTFAFGIFLFSRIPNYVGDLFGFLFGEVLAIGTADLIALALLGGDRAGDRGGASGRNCCTRRSTRLAPPRPACPSSASTTCSSR